MASLGRPRVCAESLRGLAASPLLPPLAGAGRVWPSHLLVLTIWVLTCFLFVSEEFSVKLMTFPFPLLVSVTRCVNQSPPLGACFWRRYFSVA